ncbi:MAG: hypothetical protein IT510_02360 [Sulfuritalea sp.]|nr:hypothetical protein [Sulfuritalea sp.]
MTAGEAEVSLPWYKPSPPVGLLDDTDPSLTLTTLASAAAALGRKVNIQFAAA